MILVDTNVVSEMMRPQPSPRVAAWLDAQLAETLFLSAVSLAELRAGIAVMPDGRRKQALQRGLDDQAVVLFGPRVVPFDAAAAQAFAAVVRKSREVGQPVGFADALVAATAAALDFTVATRDVTPFRVAGLRVINPWIDGP